MAYISDKTIEKLFHPSEAPTPGKVYLTKKLLILGIIEVAFFAIVAVIAAFSGESLWLALVLGAFGLLGIALIVGFINCRITYTEEGFVATTFLGVTRIYTYDQVTAMKEDLRETFIYIGKRRVMVDYFHVGGKEFITFVKKKYLTLHYGQPIPEPEKVKFDLFNGHIKDSLSLFVAYIIMAVFAIGMLIFSVVFVYFSPSTVDNTINHPSVQFISCDVYEDDIVLFSKDLSEYRIRFIDEAFDTNSILHLYTVKKSVTVYCEEMTPKYSDSYYDIKAIERNGKYVLSFEETERLQQQGNQDLIWISVGLCVFFALYFAGAIIVGRNPQNYSKWVVRIFFKKRYINTDETGDDCE